MVKAPLGAGADVEGVDAAGLEPKLKGDEVAAGAGADAPKSDGAEVALDAAAAALLELVVEEVVDVALTGGPPRGEGLLGAAPASPAPPPKENPPKAGAGAGADAGAELAGALLDVVVGVAGLAPKLKGEEVAAGAGAGLDVPPRPEKSDGADVAELAGALVVVVVAPPPKLKGELEAGAGAGALEAGAAELVLAGEEPNENAGLAGDCAAGCDCCC